MDIKNRVIGAAGAVVAFLGMAKAALAADPTPTITEISSDASQLLVNGVGSIQAALYDIAELIWPYVLGVMLFFLVIRFGMRFFRSK